MDTTDHKLLTETLTSETDDYIPHEPVKRKDTRDTDSGSSFESAKAPRVYTALERYFWLQPLAVILMTAGSTYWQYISHKKEYDGGEATFSWLHVFWLVPIPYVLIGFWGTLLPYREEKRKEGQAPREYNRLFLLVCTRGINDDAVQRTFEAINCLEDPERNIFVKIITEERYPLPNIPESNKILLPTDYVCSKAKYKARALEYFRFHMDLQDNDFVYHLDEESIIGRYELNSALNFIRNTTHDMGQGLILYNAWNFYGGAGLQGLLCNICDNIRLGDDLGRFHLQYSKWHLSYFGCHGSNLLVSGKLTHAVTWDNDSLTEDFFFAIRGREAGFTCGHIGGFCREQSPDNVHDLMKQRRRWFLGISRSKDCHARIHTFFWLVGSVACFLTLVNFFLNQVVHPLWAVAVFAFIYSFFIVIYVTATLLQTVDAGYPFWKVILVLALVIFVQPICAFLESLSIFYAVVSPVKTFDVIRK